MANFFSTLFVATAWATVLGVGAGTTVKQLDAATRAQCANRSWPAHQAKAHIDFCKAYLN